MQNVVWQMKNSLRMIHGYATEGDLVTFNGGVDDGGCAAEGNLVAFNGWVDGCAAEVNLIAFNGGVDGCAAEGNLVAFNGFAADVISEHLEHSTIFEVSASTSSGSATNIQKVWVKK